MYLSHPAHYLATYFWKSRHFNTFLVPLESNVYLAARAGPILPQKLSLSQIVSQISSSPSID